MAAKCPKCGAFVSKKGEFCTLCKYQNTMQGQEDIKPAAQQEEKERNGGQSFVDRRMIQGIVQNYMVSPSSDNAVIRWMKSLFTGVPFTTAPNRISFNVIDTESLRTIGKTGVKSAHVQIYGAISAGDICNGQNVKVWGKRDSNHVWYASKIQNSLTGVITIFDKCIPSMVIRIITLFMFIIPIFMVMAAGGAFTEGSAGAGSPAGAMAVAAKTATGGILVIGKIFLILAAAVSGYKVFKAFRVPLRYLFAGLLLLLCLLFPAVGLQVGTIVLMAYALVKLIGLVIK